MIRDIKQPEVDGIALAVIKELNEDLHEEWTVYLINKKTVPIELVLVSSRGYGTVNKEEVKTSEMRHFLEDIPANSFRKVELIPNELHGISNQYWVSFRVGETLYDKKYVFLPESIKVENMTTVPVIGKKGILIV
jgi:hypothetical protein